MHWTGGERWSFVRNLWDLEGQQEQLRQDMASKAAEASKAKELAADLAAHETMLLMQGTWRDAHGKDWHVNGYFVRCGSACGYLRVVRGGVVLRFGDAQRIVLHCKPGNIVHWTGDLMIYGTDAVHGPVTDWTFVADSCGLQTKHKVECARHAASQRKAVRKIFNLRSRLCKEEERAAECAARQLSAFSVSLATRSHELATSDPCHKVLSQAFVASIRGHRLHYGSTEWCAPAKVKIERMELLQKEHLTQAYLMERSRMRECAPIEVDINTVKCRISAGSKNEYFLFHGAPKHILEMIKEDGFDPRRGGEAAGKLFGVGSYFAENASKSDLYAEPDAAGLRSQLVVRVALGNAYTAKENLANVTHAPYVDDSKTQMHDSVLALTRGEGGCVDFREYIVYKAAQALPVAQIWYMHLPHCQCNLCRRSRST